MALKFLNDGYFAGKVGIGTESPSRNLQVKGTANTAIAITSSTSSLAQLALGDTDDDNYAQIILDNSTNKLQIQNGGGGIISNRGITLDSSENVGIGTDDPIELLHLYGGVGNPTRIRLQADDGQDDVLTFHQSTTQKGAVGYDDSDDVVSLTYGGLSGTTGIKINSSGNVGIGTTSPTAKLQVAGTTTYNSDSAQALRVCDATDVSKGIHIGFDTTLDAGIIQAADFGVSYRNLLLNPNANNVGIGEISPNAKLHVNAGTENTVALFESTDARSRIVLKDNSGEGQLSAIGDNITFATSSSATERMRITSAGGISFGSTGTAYGTSGQVLTSAGNASPTWTTPTTGTVTGGGSNTYLAKWTTATNINSSAMFQAASGNFSIGITTPNAKLSVVNDISIGTSATDVLRLSNISGVGGIYGFGSRNLAFGSITNGEVMRVDNINERVGIGTTSPDAKLDVIGQGIFQGSTTSSYKGANVGTLNINNNSADGTVDFTQGLVFTDNVTNQGSWTHAGIVSVGSTGYNGSLVFGTDGDGVRNTSGITEKMRIDSAGNVGIGTTGPLAKFQVSGNSLFESDIFTLQNKGIFFNGLSDFSSGIAGIDSGTSVRIFAGGSEKVRVKSTGNVGIGTTSPDLKLDVTHATAGEYVATFQNTGSNLELKLGVTSTGYLNIQGQQINNSAAFNISLQADGGSVGINTTIPTQKLHVVGNARVTGAYYDSNNSPGTANQVLVSTATGTDWVDGSGSSIIGGPYLPLAGGTMTGVAGVVFPDSFKLNLGTNSNLKIYHGGTNSHIDQNGSGDLYIKNSVVDGDIFFQSDDGTGTGVTNYFTINGGGGETRFQKFTRHNDGVKAQFGNGDDLQIYHDGSNSYIKDAGTGILAIQGNIIALENTSGVNYFVGVDGAQAELYYNGSSKLQTTSGGIAVTGDINIDSALLSNQENTDVDTGTETVASVAIATYTAAFFDFVIKKTTNVRSGTVYACHDGTNVEFTETSTQDLGDTSDVTLSVDISGGNMRLRATTTSDDWSIKSLIRAI
jgi:hypothetical protein